MNRPADFWEYCYWPDIVQICQQHGYDAPDVVNGVLYGFQGSRKIQIEDPDIVKAIDQEQKYREQKYREELIDDIVESYTQYRRTYFFYQFMLAGCFLQIVRAWMTMALPWSESGFFTALASKLEDALPQALSVWFNESLLDISTSIINIWFWLFILVTLVSIAFGLWSFPLRTLEMTDGRNSYLRALVARGTVPAYVVVSLIAYLALM